MDVVTTINRQVAQKRYCIVVFVYDNGKETEWGEREKRERKKMPKTSVPVWLNMKGRVFRVDNQ